MFQVQFVSAEMVIILFMAGLAIVPALMAKLSPPRREGDLARRQARFIRSLGLPVAPR